MTLGHEELDVYRLSIGYVAWVYEMAETLAGVHRRARNQWLRASQSIPISIAIWMKTPRSPDQALRATLDSAP